MIVEDERRYKHAILHDQGSPEEPSPSREDSESDHERSSELGDER